MRSRRLALLFPALAAALVLSALLGLAMGSARLGFGEVAQALAGKGGETARLIVWQLRAWRAPCLPGPGLPWRAFFCKAPQTTTCAAPMSSA